MAKKFYVVWAGRQTGVFTDWPTAHRSVDGFPGAKYKSFPTQAEANDALRAGSPPRVVGAARKVQATASPATGNAASDTAGLQIYCDGACEPNPGNAGSGLVVYRDGKLAELWYGLYNPNGTNNTAELNALLSALLMAEKTIEAGATARIFCDSTYSINCVSKWAAGWERKGWRKADGEIKNLAIIQAAYAVYTQIESSLELIHVKGHAGTEGNELADRMAMYAVESREPHLRQWNGSLDIKEVLRMRRG